MKKYLLTLLMLLFVGCGEEQIVLDTYAPPHEANKVKEMITKNKNGSAYLIMDIVDNINYITNHKNTSTRRTIARYLLADINHLITQTNFIAVSRVKNDYEIPLSLDMKIIKFYFHHISDGLKAGLSVEFNIRKNYNLIYSKVYSANVEKHLGLSSQGLPSKEEIISYLVKRVTKKFMKDITPLKTQKLVTLKKLPDEIAYSIQEALQGDYKGAIKLMLSYKGKKDYAYYYDLAVYYEGLATEENDVTYLAQADKYYNKAIALGGLNDKDVVRGKQEFDNFYNLIKTIAKQKLENMKKLKNGEYELLE